MGHVPWRCKYPEGNYIYIYINSTTQIAFSLDCRSCCLVRQLAARRCKLRCTTELQYDMLKHNMINMILNILEHVGTIPTYYDMLKYDMFEKTYFKNQNK